MACFRLLHDDDDDDWGRAGQYEYDTIRYTIEASVHH